MFAIYLATDRTGDASEARDVLKAEVGLADNCQSLEKLSLLPNGKDLNVERMELGKLNVKL